MNDKIFIRLILCLALLILGCSKDAPVSTELAQSEQGSVLGKAGGATQIAGIAYFAEEGECTDAVTGPNGQDPDYGLRMTGDLEGCHYVFVETSDCSPSGTYLETGTEIFVGRYKGGAEGSFSTTYKFEAKYEDCSNLVGEIVGRCQHPIVAGSGTGAFVGVTGRLDMKDDIEAGNFPYGGHLRF
jgi:hypothetical protein